MSCDGLDSTASDERPDDVALLWQVDLQPGVPAGERRQRGRAEVDGGAVGDDIHRVVAAAHVAGEAGHGGGQADRCGG